MKQTLVRVGKVSEYLIYFFLFAVLFIILSPRLPTKNFIQTYIVPTGSMYPSVLPGSVVVINPKNNNPEVGDIVAFSNPVDSYETILHRINKINEKGYITKGDNNNSIDSWTVPKTNIKGSLIISIPYLGHVAAFVKKPIGFLILALIPSVLLIGSFLLDIKRGISEEVTKRKDKKKNIIKLSIVTVFFFIFGFHLGEVQVTPVFAAFIAQAKITGLSIAASTATPSPTPTVSPSPTPTISPTPTPTHSPSPTPTNNPGSCQDLDIVIEGNGAGSVNSVLIKCIKETVVIQFNELHNTNNINYNFHYDSNQGPQGVLGDIHLDGESTIVKDLFMGSCSSKECVANSEIKNKKLKIKFS